MAVTHQNLSAFGIYTSDNAQVHVGHNNYEQNVYNYYGDESHLSLAERQKAREDAILASLSFPEMSGRERAIDEPCDDTFDWIFEEQVTERERYCENDICNLMSRWLEHEHGMFFIVGNAGSGKSTLMRFLAGHKQTSTLLQTWAERKHCVLAVCAHYFWCSGSQLQSSQEGLWRSILHAIAKSNRKLASAMFANRAYDDAQPLAQLRSQPWARNDLISALSLLVAHLEVQKVALCLFIDGLDEYQGDELKLIEELRQLLTSPYIKICASSRPRNLFEEAFGREDYPWKLALHLLTQGDMLKLAHTRLENDVVFCELFNDTGRREDFVMTVVNKSQGVFTWFVLVIEEMIREAHQSDRIGELEERLDALPVELGGSTGLYQRIINHSDPRYRKYMARLLLVMLEAGHQVLFWEDVHFLYDDARIAAFATQECLGVDDKYRLAWDEKTDEPANQSWESPDSHTSCRGLFLACHEGRSGVHVRGVNCRVHQIRLADDTRRQIRKWCPDFVDTHDRMWPQFLHRSVGEYLSLSEIHKDMIDRAGRGFDPVLTKCCLRLAHSRLKPGQREMGNFEHDFLEMVASVNHERRDFVRAILPEFERIQDIKWSNISVDDNDKRNLLDQLWAKRSCYGWIGGDTVLYGGFDISQSLQAHAWFLSLVARERMVWYCHEHWSRVPMPDRQSIGTIIIAGLVFNSTGLAMSKEQADLVQCLLLCGVDPNTKYTWNKHEFLDESVRQMEMSLWEAYVSVFPKVWTSRSETDIQWALDVMQLLLRDGHADRNCCLPAGKKSLLSALTFEPHKKEKWLNCQRYAWSMFAGQLHGLLHAHGLLTREERQGLGL